MQTANDIGNMLGGGALGYLSDQCYSKRSPVGVIAVVVSFAISLTLTFSYKTIPYMWFTFFMFMIGLLLGGLHHMLCITCSSDLGQS
jgi:sugar phosphate permease